MLTSKKSSLVGSSAPFCGVAFRKQTSHPLTCTHAQNMYLFFLTDAVGLTKAWQFSLVVHLESTFLHISSPPSLFTFHLHALSPEVHFLKLKGVPIYKSWTGFTQLLSESVVTQIFKILFAQIFNVLSGRHRKCVLGLSKGRFRIDKNSLPPNTLG